MHERCKEPVEEQLPQVTPQRPGYAWHTDISKISEAKAEKFCLDDSPGSNTVSRFVLCVKVRSTN